MGYVLVAMSMVTMPVIAPMVTMSVKYWLRGLILYGAILIFCSDELSVMLYSQ